MRAFRFTESAEQDVDAILSYTLTTWGEAQATTYIDGLYHVLDLIAANPAMGRLRPELAPELRGFFYREHVIFYVLFEEELLVIRVLSARRDIRPDAFDR